MPAPNFDELQARLVPLWKSIERLNQDEQTIVVVPSLTVDIGDRRGATIQAYEERFLFLLLLLRQPRARLVYVTSLPILPSVIDYYLDLLPGVIPSHARKRLFLVSTLDGSSRPLTEKVLERPRLIRRIRELIVDPERAHLVPYNTTELERDLALALRIPMYGADPRHFHFGTKTGCRRLFAEEGVPHPLGREEITSVADAVSAVVSMRAERPEIEQVLLKLNEGVSGEGNAKVDLSGLPAQGGDGESQRDRGAHPRHVLRERRDDPRPLPGKTGVGGGRGRGADHGRRAPVAERPAAGHAARRGRAALDARPAARRSERPDVHRLPVPGRRRVRTSDHRGGGEDRRAPRRGRRDRTVRPRLRHRTAKRLLGPVRDRAQPPQRGYDPPLPHASVPDRRDVRSGAVGLHGAERPGEALRRERPRREPGLQGPGPGRPVRHRRPPRAPFRPCTADRGRVPHDGRARGGGLDRDDRGRRHSRGRRPASTARRSRCSTKRPPRRRKSRLRLRVLPDALHLPGGRDWSWRNR